MNVLVTGGRGYIGSHACKLLARAGHEVVCVDDESRGHTDVSRWATIYRASTHDTTALLEIFKNHSIDAVMHFAAYAYVGESVQEPLLYYQNNVTGTISLLKAMQLASVPRLIFSSTCATYGEMYGDRVLTEELTQHPVNPYGRSKYFCEGIIRDACATGGLSAVAFRYFNASGADPEGDLGEDHDPETHLVPLSIRAALQPEITLTVNGTDFETPDGTAIRDFVHVCDIAEAHILGLNFLLNNEGFHAFNLGNNRGHSILQVIAATESLVGKKINRKYGARRPGDPAVLVGSNSLAAETLGWAPAFNTLESILETAIRWESRRKQQS